jgi:hypothetical protein
MGAIDHFDRIVSDCLMSSSKAARFTLVAEWRAQGRDAIIGEALQFRAISLGHIELFGGALNTNVQLKSLARKAGFQFSRPSDWRAVRFGKTLAGRIVPPWPGSGPEHDPEERAPLSVATNVKRSRGDHAPTIG